MTPIPKEIAEALDVLAVMAHEKAPLWRRRQARARVEQLFAELARDKERIDWIEQQHTLHKAVEFLYVVDGYQAQPTCDGDPVGDALHGETLRGAIDAARAAGGEG